jgi:hypothetical protein
MIIETLSRSLDIISLVLSAALTLPLEKKLLSTCVIRQCYFAREAGWLVSGV